MSLGFVDGKPMRRLFRVLRKTGLNYFLTFLATRILKRLGNGFSFRRLRTILLVGQSHLDAAWRWRWRQGVLKARATFKKALDHIDEIPQFTFAQPSPCYYWWMERYFPQIFHRIKTAVQKGQWLPVGGMWVEADCNIPSGESLIRQRLYGQRYYLEKFGLVSEVEILQDCFGFNWNLPQILVKSGAKFFITGKLFWNDTNTFPLGMAIWEGPDGTKLPVLHMHFGYFIPINMGKKFPFLWMLGKPGQSLRASYATPAKEIQKWRSGDLMPAHIFGYGLGDGGHGPIEAEIAIVTALARLYSRHMEWARRDRLESVFRPYYPRWATWVDEFYLELHRGVYTTVSRVKRFNREGENSLERCEKLASLVQMLGGLAPSAAEFAKAWKIVLFNQFHDILPGSSIPEVYADSDFDAAEVGKFITQTVESCLSFLAANVRLPEGTTPALIVFNPLSWARGGVVEVPQEALKKQGISDFGAYPAVQLNPEKHTALIHIPKVLALGYQVFPTSTKQVLQVSPAPVKLTISGACITLDNEILNITVNATTGEIDSITNNSLKFVGIQERSNRIRLFKEEGKKVDAWDIDKGYKGLEIPLPLEATSVKVAEEGPLRAMVEVQRAFRGSTFTQRISLAAGAEVVTCDMDVDWREPLVLVKLGFATPIHANKVSCEIPYAYIDRPVVPANPLDDARWEYCGQKWVSVSDGARGVTITNNCKYGFNLEGQELRMTVLRSPKYTGYASETVFVNRGPNGQRDPAMPEFTDLEVHNHITYEIFLHAGDWREVGWKKALELNHPLIAKVVNASSSQQLPLEFCFASIDSNNIEIACVKEWEESHSVDGMKYLVFRLIERGGNATPAKIRFSESYKVAEVAETDLLERRIGSVECRQNVINVPLTPYEIKTILVGLKFF